MFRALLWKEWRQLALVRWGGIALGALLPVAFTTGAELAKRGLLPTGEVKAYSPRDLMFELLPAALALGLWPLIALMSAAQAFAADRAAGTESFLLERPVPRAAVWRARVAASIGTLLLVIVATAALGAIVASLTGAPEGIGWTRWRLIAPGGVAVALLAWLGGLVAATLLTSPLGAVLAGAVLAGLPVLLAALLAAVFAHARYGAVPLGAVLPALMLPAYVVASWSASCRGEPAGRGRVKRGIAITAGALLGVIVSFVAGAPIVARANAATGMHGVVVSPSGRTAFVGDASVWGEGGWIVDVASGRRLRFIPPPVSTVVWRADGGAVAVDTWSGALGSDSRFHRLDVYDAAGTPQARSIPIPDGWFLRQDAAWTSEGLVAALGRWSESKKTVTTSVQIYGPERGWRPTGFEREGGLLTIVGPTTDGRLFLREVAMKDGDDPKLQRVDHYTLRPIDVAAARVGEPVATLDGDGHWFSWNSPLSPSGRYAVVGERTEAAETKRAQVVPLAAGGTAAGTAVPTSHVSWLAGDRMIWVEAHGPATRLLTGRVAEAPSVVREWTGAAVRLVVSPDLEAAFVSVLPVDPASAPQAPGSDGRVPEEGVYVAGAGRWIDMPIFSGRVNDQRYTVWAGTKTLARIAPGVVYFEDIDKPGGRRFVIGGERDLR